MTMFTKVQTKQKIQKAKRISVITIKTITIIIITILIISFPITSLAEETKTTITQYEREELARMLYGEDRYDDTSTLAVMRKAAVIQVVLNRLDSGIYGGVLFDHRDAIVRKSQFRGYSRKNPVEQWALDIVNQACDGWEAEQRGEENGWRVLPQEYLYFGSTGSKVNRFRDQYDVNAATIWDFDNLAGEVWLDWGDFLQKGDDTFGYG